MWRHFIFPVHMFIGPNDVARGIDVTLEYSSWLLLGGPVVPLPVNNHHYFRDAKACNPTIIHWSLDIPNYQTPKAESTMTHGDDRDADQDPVGHGT